ncbi:MAG: histidine triad nucleotide-binding protein [Myxococcales bacterium]|nr:histidine triad nucleotide-binding protein [Myxococcales bacterium]
MAKGEITPKTVLEDDEVLAFHDISPQAPVHVLVIPKRHVESLAAAEPADQALLGKLLWTAREVAQKLGLDAGYRTVLNSGAEAGQSVFHLHLHVLGGRAMAWPPG